jgi:hypothetical protein
MWIATSDRLPDVDKIVLVTVESRVLGRWMQVASRGDHAWRIVNQYGIEVTVNQRVIAWMVIPEHY